MHRYILRTGTDWSLMTITCSHFQGHTAFLYPRFEKWGVYWFTSVRGSDRPSICPSVIP